MRLQASERWVGFGPGTDCVCALAARKGKIDSYVELDIGERNRHERPTRNRAANKAAADPFQQFFRIGANRSFPSHVESFPAPPMSASPRLRAIILGSGAGGGVPQWNCGCRVCRLAWSGDPRVSPRTQCSLAVSADGEYWLLLNASIDLREQILATPALRPRGPGRSSPIAAALLTGTDVDIAAGLLTLRERQPLTIWGTRQTLDTIAANRIFAVVANDIAPRRAVALGERFEPLPGLQVELFATPGKVPLWLEEGDVLTDQEGEQTVGAAVEVAGRRLVFAPGCSRMTEALQARVRTCQALFFDGTLFEDDEMIRAGLGEKTGRRMGHMPVSGVGGSLDALAQHSHVRRIYVHINNTNPMLIDGSREAETVAAAGWEIGRDGMEVLP
jgi:pyrroloquinoline quinone biosynthesis protein B